LRNHPGLKRAIIIHRPSRRERTFKGHDGGLFRADGLGKTDMGEELPSHRKLIMWEEKKGEINYAERGHTKKAARRQPPKW